MQKLFSVLLLIFWCSKLPAQTPLSNAHAHNDYEHEHPFYDAVQHGFASVEADIWLINGELYVSHEYPKQLQGITLKELYLTPLQKRLQLNQGRVYKDWNGIFYLMIDIKTNGKEVYPILKKLLLQYPEFQKNNHLKIFLSGDRPIAQIQNDTLKIAGIDGRPEDIGKNYKADVMPVISENYNKFCKWKGIGEIPENEYQLLKNLSESVHKEGKKLRLWATPDNKAAWKTLQNAGIDFINTDKIEEFAQYKKAAIWQSPNNKTIVIAHRGNHQNAPENTLESLKNAISAGVDYVEIDIRTTLDSQLVILHDATVNRTTNGKGKVSELKLHEFKKLTPNGGKAGSSLPTFEEILREAQGKVNLYLDAKACNPVKVVELLKKYKMENAVVVYTEPDEASVWKKALPDISVMVSPPKNLVSVTDLEDFIIKNQIDILDGSILFYTREKVELLRKYNIPVWADIQNPNENPEQWQKAIDLNLAGLQTDFPEKLILFLKSINK
jgi:glycerophosphoryl diester phosphodiesterase